MALHWYHAWASRPGILEPGNMLRIVNLARLRLPPIRHAKNADGTRRSATIMALGERRIQPSDFTRRDANCWQDYASGDRTPILLTPSSDGNSTSENERKMALTKAYKLTVLNRIRGDRKFASALFGEAISALIEGETDEGLSILRDLVHAEITFKELARQTNLGEKTLHRMLNHKGNPTARNLGLIVKSIATDLKIRATVACLPAGRTTATRKVAR